MDNWSSRLGRIRGDRIEVSASCHCLWLRTRHSLIAARTQYNGYLRRYGVDPRCTSIRILSLKLARLLPPCSRRVESVSGIGALPTLFPQSWVSSGYLDADARSWSHTTATICCEHRYRPAPVRAEMRARQGSLNPNHGNLFGRNGSALKQRATDSGARGSLCHDQTHACPVLDANCRVS